LKILFIIVIEEIGFNYNKKVLFLTGTKRVNVQIG
jgi:hypothetical protein